MTKTIGQATTCTYILPNTKALAKIRTVKLSREAKHRLAVIEHYLTKTHNISLTCRHFAICRSYFYKWYKRYDPKNLSSLENRSRRPHDVRPATYDTEFVGLIRKLRTERPSYSAKKLARIVFRDYGITYSAATIGRIIKRYGLYFRAKIILSKQRSKRAVQAWKKRKPYDLKAVAPRQVIEFDMKHIYVASQKHYAYVAVDPFTKEALIHTATSSKSWQARIALEKVLERFGSDVCILNDNDSENLGHSYQYLKDQDITQYFTRPHTPKDKPHVENLIGKYQQECLDEDKTPKTILERQLQANKWLNDYHYYRPHQALDYLTPSEYCDTLGLTIRRAGVSMM
jgi:transposase InsO family protein